MIRLPPRSTRPDTLFPYTTLFRSPVSQLRLNPLTGRWVTLAADRATRPGDLTARRSGNEFDDGRPCPFCPGNEDATPPALETYGPGGSWLVRVVPNLYPAFEGNEPMRVPKLGPVFPQAAASGDRSEDRRVGAEGVSPRRTRR